MPPASASSQLLDPSPARAVGDAGELHARLVNLDVLRAAAAVGVLAIHAYSLGGRTAPIQAQRAFDVPLINLAAGVWLFFAISGFVIGRPFVEALLGGRRAPSLVPYALRRALRVYPLYWVVLSAFVAVAGLQGTRAWQIPFHVLLLHNLVPGRQEALFSPAWTLTLEILFYACLPTLFRVLARRAGRLTPARLARLILTSWVASIAFAEAVDLLGDGRVGLWLRFSLPAMWQMFCPGLLLALLPHLDLPRLQRSFREPLRERWWWAAVALLIPAGVLYAAAPLRWGVVPYELLSDAARPLFAVGFGAIVGAALGSRPWCQPRSALVRLGIVSYGIYLIHPVLVTMALKWHVAPLHGGGLVAFAVNALAVAAATIPLALLSWRLLERPVLGLAGRLAQRWEAGEIDPAAHPRQWRRAMVVVFSVALLVRVFVVLDVGHFVPATDAADYDRIAVTLATTHRFPGSELTRRPGPSAFRPPAFPIFLAGVYAITGTASPVDRWRDARIAEAVLGALSVWLLALVARELLGPGLALLAAALAAIYPPLILIGSSLMSESLFIPLVLAATWCALRARRSPRPTASALACGMLIALSGLTRSVGLVIALPLAALMVTREGGHLESLRRVGIAAAAAVITLMPWTIRNLETLHAFVPISTEGGFALAGTYNGVAQHRADYPALWAPPVVQIAQATRAHPQLSEAQLSSRLTSDGLAYIKAHPAYVLEVVGLSAVRMLGLPGPALERYEARFVAYDESLAVLSVYAFWVVGLLALIAVARRLARGVPWAFWGVPAVIFLAGCLFSGTQRYRAPADPFLLILGALALRHLTTAPRAGRRRRRALPSPSA